jgi:hypothetical protein
LVCIHPVPVPCNQIVYDATAQLILHAHVIFFIFLKFADVSTTMIVKPGPIFDFLLANQKVDHPSRIDWQKVSCVFV